MLTALAVAFGALIGGALAYEFVRAVYGSRAREQSRDLALERERTLDLRREADELSAALRKLAIPPDIAATVVQRYRLDVTCPNCHGLAERGQRACCKACDYEHEMLRRDVVVRAAHALYLALAPERYTRHEQTMIDLQDALRAGGWIDAEDKQAE